MINKTIMMKYRPAFSLLPLAVVLFAELAHAQPTGSKKPRMLYPDFPGASQTCVVPIDQATRRINVAPSSDERTELMLISANSEAQCQVFVISKQRISIAGRPDLCVNIGGSARRGLLYLEKCGDVSVTGWEIKGTSTSSSRVRALGGLFDNMCWEIPSLSDEKAKYPLRVLPAVCQKNVANQLKFFVE
ncbi:MAG: hypothetical protein VKL00_03270 [Synechococcales bacterium]|nr:hypothetical protein [Synechococcales bacterium]